MKLSGRLHNLVSPMEKIRGWNMTPNCNIFNDIISPITHMNPTDGVPEVWHQTNSRCHSSEYNGNNTFSSVRWHEMIMRCFRGWSVQRLSKRVPSFRLPYFQYGWNNIFSPVSWNPMAVRQSGLWWMPGFRLGVPMHVHNIDPGPPQSYPLHGDQQTVTARGGPNKAPPQLKQADGGSSTCSVAVNFKWARFLLLLVFSHQVGGDISQLDDLRMLLDIRYDSCSSRPTYTCALKFNNETAVCFGDCDAEKDDGNYVTNATLQEELKKWCGQWRGHMETNLLSILNKRNGSAPGCGVLQNTHGWILNKDFNETGVVYQYALNGSALTEDDVADFPSDPIRHETDRPDVSNSELIEDAKQFVKDMPILRQCLDALKGILKKKGTPVKDDNTPDRLRNRYTIGIPICFVAVAVGMFVIWMECSGEKKKNCLRTYCVVPSSPPPENIVVIPSECIYKDGVPSSRPAKRVSGKEEEENWTNTLIATHLLPPQLNTKVM